MASDANFEYNDPRSNCLTLATMISRMCSVSPAPRPPGCKKIVVVGAGVAGLQAARQLLTAGFKVILLEANEDVGGVWRQNYKGFGLQGA